ANINLVWSAVKSAAAGGPGESALQPAGDGTSSVVADDGRGIREKHMPHIFDRFYRGDSARSRDPDGMGLGLAIVKSIVDLHEGRIDVESRRGQGTRVTMQLKRSPAERSLPSREPTDLGPSPPAHPPLPPTPR